MTSVLDQSLPDLEYSFHSTFYKRIFAAQQRVLGDYHRGLNSYKLRSSFCVKAQLVLLYLCYENNTVKHYIFAAS